MVGFRMGLVRSPGGIFDDSNMFLLCSMERAYTFIEGSEFSVNSIGDEDRNGFL